MNKRLIGAVGLIAAVLLSACGGDMVVPPGSTPTSGQGSGATAAPTNTAVAVGDPNARLLINGAGATFPVPIYTKWFAEYSNVEKDVRFNYQAIGSGAGIQQVQNGTVDFGGSDAPMTDEQLQKAQGGEIFHIPTVSGAVVAIYNLEGAAKGLKLDGETLAKIYLGEITSWDDPAITGQNAEMASVLKGDIAVVHRADGSGTTNIYTSYLAAVSPEWKANVGSGTSVKWPVGLGARGNAGVAGLIQQTPGSIGYVELAYAKQNDLPYAYIKNGSGEFIEPTIEATTLAAQGVTVPDDLRVSIVNSGASGSYPIAGFTYILVYKQQKDAAKGEALAKFLWWATHDGESLAASLDYAPLSDDLTKRVEQRIKALDCGGSPCYK